MNLERERGISVNKKRAGEWNKENEGRREKKREKDKWI